MILLTKKHLTLLVLVGLTMVLVQPSRLFNDIGISLMAICLVINSVVLPWINWSTNNLLLKEINELKGKLHKLSKHPN
ncbi:MAG TPA: hypothetical protein QF353_02930 [Gammaproteobacteria bacterium]|nr:hypothetical protein [Gammaproteobacteria bacterium]